MDTKIKNRHDYLSTRKERVATILHLFVLSNFAFSQPLFDLLSRNATFFIARKSEPIDVIVLVIFLGILIPAILSLCEMIIGRFNMKARMLFHFGIVFLLSTMIVLPVLNHVGELSDWFIIILSVIFGLTAVALYMQYNAIGAFLTFLSPAIIIFPLFFLFNPSVVKVISTEKKPLDTIQRVNATASVVMIVFDAFSLTSLLTEENDIDNNLYPNMAGLAKNAYWFRNATAVADYTHLAVPAILTGLYPDKQRLPILSDYPDNLFTLFAGSYELVAEEPNTKLCPDRDDIVNASFTNRMRYLIEDLSVAFLHIILPTGLTTHLPPINRRWNNFLHSSHFEKPAFLKNDPLWLKKTTGDRPAYFFRFINSIKKDKKPRLYFLHCVIPHAPYRYLPSGKEYTQPTQYDYVPGLLSDETWGSDAYAVAQGYQRYLLQAAFSDKLLGAVIDKLKSIDLYDESLIVVTADHGVSFRANDKRRPITRTNYMDIMCVPLLIKAPIQQNGTIIDRNVESIDILPTIADILNIPIPWQIDGVSALDVSLPERSHKTIYASTHLENEAEYYVFEPTITSKRMSVKSKLDLFDLRKGINGLFVFGPNSELIEHVVSRFPIKTDEHLKIKVDRCDMYKMVDTDGPFIPAQTTGTINYLKESAPVNLAVSVNGKIVATTRTYPKQTIHQWSVILPEIAFHDGENHIDVYIVENDDGGHQLIKPGTRSDVKYAFSQTDKKNIKMTSNNGKTIQVISGALFGCLDKASILNDRLTLAGWAADIHNSMPVDSIVIFVDGKHVFSGQTELNRLDVAQHFHDEKLKKTGFSFNFLTKNFKDIDNAKIQIFMLSDKGIASEITYPENYKWFGPEDIETLHHGIIQVIHGRLFGFLEEAKIVNDHIIFNGWAIDNKYQTPAETIQISCNGKPIYSGQMNKIRSDVAQTLDNANLDTSGFFYKISLKRFMNIENAKIRVFAISNDGVASELLYPKGYQWF